LEYLNTPSKFYCRDIGLRNVRLNFREQNKGFLIENCVYNELKTRGYDVDVGFIEKKFKDKNGKWQYKQNEVDFIARKYDKQYYIQVVDQMPKDGHEENEYESLRSVPGSFKKLLVVNDNFIEYTNNDGILIISLEKFLLDNRSLDI
ncbi:MAG: DUF4143 domain-containing protein, partial [Bacillales bacterium]|nr:DUF4143 domain-containing protein [Bacillales bacterium]